MPVTIKSSQVKVKGTDGYIGVDALADSTTASRISAINSAGASALEDIQSEGQSNVSAIEQKGAEVLENIPDDYTQLEEDVSELKSALNGDDVDSVITLNITANEWVTSTGTFETANGWSRTDKIDIGNAKSVTVDKSSVNIALYNSDGDFLNVRTTLTANTAYTLGDSVGKIVLYAASATENSMTAFFTKPSPIAEIPVLANEIDTIKNQITIHPSAFIPDTLISSSNGSASTSTDWNATDFIELPFDEISSFSVKAVVYGIAGVAIYNKDKQMIFGISTDNVSTYGGASNGQASQMTIPHQEGMKYIRFCVRKVLSLTVNDVWVRGNTLSGAFEHIFDAEEDIQAIKANVPTTISGSKVLVIGDSISTDAYGSYTKWVTVLKNSGFFPSDTNNSSQHATGFVARYNNEANDFITRLKAVSTPSQYDLVIVFGGINDYIQNIPMGSETGTDYTVSFKPAVNEFFNYLIQNFTQARLCVLLPLRTYATWQNSQGEYQQAYGDYIKEVAKSYCLPVLNLTEDSGFCPYISTFSNMWTLQPAGYQSHDGVHPNEEYERRFLAPMIRDFLQGLM